jgi:hypothetical protein
MAGTPPAGTQHRLLNPVLVAELRTELNAATFVGVVVRRPHLQAGFQIDADLPIGATCREVVNLFGYRTRLAFELQVFCSEGPSGEPFFKDCL